MTATIGIQSFPKIIQNRLSRCHPGQKVVAAKKVAMLLFFKIKDIKSARFS